MMPAQPPVALADAQALNSLLADDGTPSSDQSVMANQICTYQGNEDAASACNVPSWWTSAYRLMIVQEIQQYINSLGGG